MRNAINWFEVPANDFDRAVKFYSEILGEPVSVMEFGGNKHGMFPSDEGGLSGAITPAEHMQPMAGGVLIYLNADGKLDAVVGRVEAAGGKVAVGKTDIGPHGHFAVIMDTEGNLIGLHANLAK